MVNCLYARPKSCVSISKSLSLGFVVQIYGYWLLPARNLLPFSVKHPRSSTHVSPTQFNDSILPVPFLAKQFVDLVIQVTNLELAKAGVLDL